MGIPDPAELKKLPVVRWIESTSVDRALIVTGKALVYVGIVAGLYVLTPTDSRVKNGMRLRPRGRFGRSLAPPP